MFRTTRRVLGAMYLLTIIVGCGDNDSGSVVPKANAGEVSGTTTDSVSGSVLSNVKVAIGNNKTVSDVNGYYSLTGISAGSTTIIADLPGYGSHTGSVSVIENITTTHDITLVPQANSIVLDEFGFENGTVNPFIGNWVLDTSSANSGTSSLRPPQTLAGVTTSAEINYTKSHTLMAFSIKITFDQTQVDLFIDNKYYDSYPSLGWQRYTILVPEGTHTYRWEVTRNVTEQPRVFLDDISFSNTAPQADSTGPYGFEQGYMTQEFSTWANSADGWIIDDTHANNGNFSIHPPYVISGNTSSTQLNYTQVHTQIEFYLFVRFDQIQVDLYIDDQYYESYTPSNGKQVKVLVPQGTHNYRWDVTPTDTGLPPVYLDDITFTNTTPTINATGPYGFEEEFITPEFSTWANKTNGWIIDNSSPLNGEFSLHPPFVAAGIATSTEIFYSLPHSKILFTLLVRFDGIKVDLFIDDVLHRTYPQGNALYSEVPTVTGVAHTYRWEVTSNNIGHPPVALDDITFQ